MNLGLLFPGLSLLLLLGQKVELDDPMTGPADVELSGPAVRAGPPPAESALFQAGEGERTVAEVTLVAGERAGVFFRGGPLLSLDRDIFFYVGKEVGDFSLSLISG
jgi:hypothetical protein